MFTYATHVIIFICIQCKYVFHKMLEKGKNMRKLALSDEILMQIEKPARYIGNEVNSVTKDAGKVDVRFAMCFPDVYEIGMSHLGIQILYDMFNRREDVWCERVYSPWPDLGQIMKEEQIPLFALESQEPVNNFDFLGITIQYEMCYTNILQILDLSHIPILAKDRTGDEPLVIGGGLVPIIRNHWRISLICSTSVMVRQFMMNFWMLTKQIKKQVEPERIFYLQLLKSKEFMFLPFMMLLIGQMARLHPSCPTEKGFQQ